jgi:riboflavin kinase / FMN adenylyltransferase
MEIIRRVSEIKKRHRNGILTIGTFDGIHRGHQAVIKKVQARAAAVRGKSVILTFYPNPIEVLCSKGRSISTLKEKIGIIRKIGVDVFIILRFTKKFASLSPQRFIRKVLLKIAPREVIVGSNHTFGRKGKGGIALLEKYGRIHHFKVSVVNLKKYKKKRISSTEIRTLIRLGNMKKAGIELGRYFSLSGKVVEGKGRGKILGFPTANLKVSSLNILPGNGVYSGYVRIAGKKYRGVINVGYCPTFRERLKHPRIEVFIAGFKGRLYGRILKVHFSGKIRDEKKFSNAEALKLQIKRDILKLKREV